MADENDRDDLHCGFGGGAHPMPEGIPPNGEIPPDDMTGPGTYYTAPQPSSMDYSPDQNIGVYGLCYQSAPGLGSAYFGIRGTLDGKHFIQSVQHGTTMFDSEDAMNAYMRKMGVRDVADRESSIPRHQIEALLKEGNGAGGFPTPGHYAVAPPVIKMLMRQITRLTGNGWESVVTYASLDHANDLAQQYANANIIGRYRSLTKQQLSDALERTPMAVMDQTAAGALLNKYLWLQTNLYDKDAVLNHLSRALGLGDYAGALENARNQIGANASGLFSAQYRLYRDIVEAGRTHGFSLDQLDMYRRAMHVAERWEMAGARAEAYAKSIGTTKERVLETYLPGLRNPSAFPEINPNTGKRFRPLPDGHEGPAPDRTPEQVAEDAQTYLKGLPEEQRRILDGVNKQLSNQYQLALDGMLKEGFVDSIHHKLYSSAQNYYPMREDDLLAGGIRPIADEGIVGRSTMSKNPTGQLLGWIEGVHRRNAQNRVNAIVYHWALGATHTGIVKINEIKSVASEIENGLSQQARPSNTEHTIIVRFPSVEKNGKPVVVRVSFNADNQLGKLLSKGNVPQPVKAWPFQAAAGFNRFASIMMTNARPAWFLKSTAWNLGLTPISVQSAFGLSTREAGRFLFGADGRSAYLSNVARVYRDMLAPNRDPAEDHFIRWLYENGAGTLNDARFDPGTGSSRAAFEMTSLRDLVAQRKPLNLLNQGSRAAWRGMLHISHTPDIAYQFGAAKTFMQMRAGREFANYDELARFMEANPELAYKTLQGSRRILPNFTRRGAATTLQSLFPFFNASAQTLPFVSKVIRTPFGLGGAASAIILGMASMELAREEFGEDGADLKNTDGHLYLGYGVQVPMDYAYHLPLQIGAQAWKMANGYTDARSAMEAVALSAMEMVSPVGVPQEGQNVASWALYGSMPYALRPAITAFSGMDAYGNPLDADSVVDPDSGRRVENPSPYQLGRPTTPGWADSVAYALHSTVGDFSAASPGRISAVTRAVIPVVPSLFDIAGGSSQARAGQVPSVGGGLLDLLAPDFQAQVDPYGARADFEREMAAAVRSAPGSSSIPHTQQNLLSRLGSNVNRYAVAHEQAASQARKVMVRGMTLPQLRARLVRASSPGGSQSDVLLYQQLLAEGQNKVDRIWRDAADRSRRS